MVRYVFLIILLGSLFCSIPRVELQSASCVTPYKQEGVCVRIYQCNNIFKLWQNSKNTTLPQQIIDYISNANCVLPKVDSHTVCCQTNQVQLLPQKCGVSSVERISYGNVTVIGEFPWMALLRYNIRNQVQPGDFCTGSLISSRYVLTAAHCIKVRSTWTLDHVRLGEHTRNQDPDCQDSYSGEELCTNVHDYKIESTITHPSHFRFNYDIGLLRLAEEVEFTEFIHPICLPTTAHLKELTFDKYTVAGWGATEENVLSDVLLKASVPLADIDICEHALNKHALRKLVLNGTIQICAGGVNHVDTCWGDSGGPLMHIAVLESGISRYVQFGITSGGVSSCGQLSVPGIYGRLSNLMDWVLATMKP